MSRRIDFDSKKVSEAFRAGNRARKKESVQDAVESVDNIRAQIDLFKEQTGKELEIRDGRPYFDRSLGLDDCTGLTGLPAGLKVNGYLSLEHCTGLTSLPAGLEVKGDLWLDNCTGLISLPADLKVNGVLSLRGCTGLINLPVGLEVGADLWLVSCTGLTSLPTGLKVGECLNLKGCTGLTSLPSDLVVGVSGYIIHWGMLTPFFKKLGIRVDKNGNTKASNWRKWQEAHGYLSEAFKAGNRARKKESAQDVVQSVDSIQAQIDLFKEQTGIELEIRDGRPYYNDDINLDDNDRLTAIPVNLVVMGDATFRYCKNLEICPAGLTVKGDLNFAGCENLAEIPTNLNVDGTLLLNDCVSLKSLPDGMTVGRGLSLWGCLGLTALPHRLTVGGSMSLRKCYNLKSLPSDLTVNGKAIQSIPDNLHPFIKKLGIKGVFKIDASEWMAKRHLADQVAEAFRAGNRARKKESAQDVIEGADIRVTKKTCTETVEKLAESGKFNKIGINDLLVHVISGTAAEIGEFDEARLFTAMQGHGFWKENSRWTEIKSDTGWFPDLCIPDHGEYGDGEPGGICYTWYMFDNDRTPGESVAWHRITPYSRWIIYDRFVDIIRNIIVRAHRENIPVAVGEAFRAGNRARKKETAQDTVESVDDIRAQINRFMEQTGKELEIRDGRPYFDGNLDLEGCTGLTSLPAGLKVNGVLSLTGCTGLASLPAGLEVREDLDLAGCTGLTSLPAGLEVGGDLYLEGCTRLTSLPADLKVGGRLNLEGCTGLTSLPAGLTVGGFLWLRGCTGLTRLPSDLVVQGDWILHKGILTPFFKKLRIPVDNEGDTKASDWHKWQKAHEYLTEAFKAGNKARKKEAVQDTVGISDDLLITPDRVRDYIGTDIQSVENMCLNSSWRELINRLLSEVFEKPHSNIDTYTKHENGVSISTYYYTGRESHIMVSGNNGYVMRLRVDGEGHPEKFTVGITFYDRGVRCLRGRGGDKEYETVLERDNWRRDDGYEFNDEGLLMFCQFLSTGIVPAGFAVEDVVLDEAFRAGNRARKKESVQDTVESVDSIQAQIDRFKEQTGIGLEIRDGRPYFDRSLGLDDCTGLTGLPAGLKVNGYLSLEHCTGLTSLPAGLEVGKSLFLGNCTRLTSLPAGLEVGGDLYLTGCTGLTSLPAGLTVGGSLFLNGCTGLTRLPSDLVVQGDWILHKGILTPFFRKLGIPVDKDGDTKAKDWRKWQRAHGYLTEAFRAGNRARKKEAMQDAAVVTDLVNLSFMDTIGEIESFLCRRGEQEDRVMTAVADAIDSGKWFDWRGRTEDYQALVIEVENIDGDTCNVYVYVDAAGVPSTFDATGQHRMDFECTRSLSNRAVLNNVLNIFDRLAGPAGEDELPEDLREGDENWELYKNLIQKHADFLRPFLCRQDLDRLIADGVIDEAFKAGNRARKKESVQDTVESADRPVTFDEALSEIERLIHRIGSKYKRNSHNNLYSKQRSEAQAEIFHIHPFSSNELTDNDISRDGFYPGGWSEKVTHSYDAVIDLAYFPELDRTFVMMCANVCTVDPDDIRRMSVFNSAGSYSEYYMGNYMDKDPLRNVDDYDLMGSEFFYPVDTVSDLGKILEIVTYMLTDKRWLACMALFTVCRSFSSQYTRGLLPGAICPYIRKDLRISPAALHSAVNGTLWNELLVKSNGLCGAIVDGQFTYKEILSMFKP